MSTQTKDDPRNYIGLSHFDNPKFDRNPYTTYPHQHNGNIMRVEFLEDGAKLVSTGQDGTVRLWNAKNGQLLHTLYCNSETSSKIVEDKSLLITRGDTGLSLWDIRSGVLLDVKRGGKYWWKPYGPIYNKINNMIATFVVPDLYQLWQLTDSVNKAEIKFLEEVKPGINFFNRDLFSTFRGSGGQATIGGSGAHKLCFALSGEILLVSNLSQGATIVNLEKLASPYKWLKSMSDWFYQSQVAHPREAPSGKYISEATVATLEETFTPFVFSANYKYFVGLTKDKKIRIWDWRNQSLVKSFQVDPDSYLSINYSMDGKILALGGFGGKISLWDVETREKMLEINGTRG